jgi:hypothetical protein
MSDMNYSLLPRNVKIAVAFLWIFVGFGAVIAVLQAASRMFANPSRQVVLLLVLFALLIAFLSKCVFSLANGKSWAFTATVVFCAREIFRYFYFPKNHPVSLWGAIGGVEVLLCLCILVLLLSPKSLAWYFPRSSR